MADFTRDLGYLDKFLASVRAHAGTLGGPAGSRLAQLMDEEQARWTEIRGLLASGGNPGPAAAAPANPAAPPAPPLAPSATGAPVAAPTHGGRRMRLQLTVGSLIGPKR
jgi:hypothetical protein